MLERTLADLDDVRQVLAYLGEQLAANTALAEEKTVQRILVLRALLLQRVEGLHDRR